MIKLQGNSTQSDLIQKINELLDRVTQLEKNAQPLILPEPSNIKKPGRPKKQYNA